MLDIIVNPFITLLLLFYGLLGENVFLAIVGFTIAVRMATLPLTLRQQRSMKSMQEVQPQLKELQEKYKNDRETLVQKQMELYRENKINPLAGCLPLIVQMPILIGLWRAIIATLASTPGELLSLSDRIMLPGLDNLVPMNSHFAWLNLAVPDPYLILPVLVVITTWVQQKLLTPSAPPKKAGSGDDPADQAAAMTRQMTTIMPLMFGFFALTYSSGLSIYFVVSNLIGIAQYSAMGRADFRRLIGKEPVSEEEQERIESGERRRLEGISDTRKAEVKMTTEDERTAEKRSLRRNRAKAKANRVKLDPK
jgi:YidC/Oxa1 family membrane protein insertase